MAAKPQTTAKTTQAVSNRPTGGAVALNDQIPEFMKGMRGQGTENIGQNDIETPRLKLLQAVSPELEVFDDAKAGEYWHSISEISLGKSVRIVPLYIDMRAILWRPRWDGGGILARADDGINWSPSSGEFDIHPSKDDKKRTVRWVLKPTVADSRLLEWGTHDPNDPNSAPAATRMYNMAVALPDHPDLGLAVVTLQRSAIKVARKFLGKLKLMSMPSFGCYFNMGTARDQNPAGEVYQNYAFTAAGFVQDEDEFNSYKGLYESFKRMGLNVKDLESVQDEGYEAGGGGAAAPEKQDAKASY
jgi:hypothetical protein